MHDENCLTRTWPFSRHARPTSRPGTRNAAWVMIGGGGGKGRERADHLVLHSGLPVAVLRERLAKPKRCSLTTKARRHYRTAQTLPIFKVTCRPWGGTDCPREIATFPSQRPQALCEETLWREPLAWSGMVADLQEVHGPFAYRIHHAVLLGQAAGPDAGEHVLQRLGLADSRKGALGNSAGTSGPGGLNRPSRVSAATRISEQT